MYLFNFTHFILLFETLPQYFYIAQSQKSYGVRQSVRAGSIPRRRLRLPPLPPTYAYTILLLAKKISGGVKIVRRQNNYKGASAEGSRRRTGGRLRNNYPGGRGWTKNSKKNSKRSQSAEDSPTVPKIPYSIS